MGKYIVGIMKALDVSERKYGEVFYNPMPLTWYLKNMNIDSRKHRVCVKRSFAAHPRVQSRFLAV